MPLIGGQTSSYSRHAQQLRLAVALTTRGASWSVMVVLRRSPTTRIWNALARRAQAVPMSPNLCAAWAYKKCLCH